MTSFSSPPPVHETSRLAISPSAEPDIDTPTSPHSHASSLESDDHSMSAEEDLRARLTKLRRYYTNATMTGENDRFGFEQGLMDIEIFFNDVEKSFSSQIESIKAELSLSHKEKDIKVKEWRERYQKLHDRWDECMIQLKQLQDEKEDVRQQRDLLMCTHKAKKAMTEHGSTLASGQKDKRILREFFQKRVAYRLLSSIADSIGAERGAIFVQDHKYLKSIALFPPLLKEGKAVEIKVPSDQGFVGTVFKNKEALNILNAYKDKRFYRKVDNETGFITRVVLCYPLLSPTSEKPIGVLQLINKENGDVFTVEDEARMSEYVYLVSHVLESVQKLYSFGPYLKAGTDGDANGDASPGTPTAGNRRKNIINVKRIGGEQRDMDHTGPGGQKMRKFLIPKEIEEYIRNVEQGWRKAVGESAEYQNKKALLEEERSQLKGEVSEMEKRIHEKDSQIQDLQNKFQKFQKEMKMQRVDWMDKEKDLKQEVKELKQLHTTLNRQNSTIDHLKMLRNGSMAKLLTKKASTIHLPAIDSHRNNTDHSNEDDHDVSPNHTLNVNGNNAETDLRQSRDLSPSHFASSSKYRDIYMDMFALSPVPMLLLTRQYRVWRVNQKFCTLLDCSEQDVLGVMLSDIAVGVDVETLPRLLQFDVVQGLGLQKPQNDSALDKRRSQNGAPRSKTFVKVNMQLSVLGQNGQKFQAPKNGKTLRAPIYCCAFSKKKS
uniref:GAF domain-containing protein n=1 Tax=Percolomonas cosmopolitus TaxID=63605 RepID=A0A7S1KTW7_9EUKA